MRMVNLSNIAVVTFSLFFSVSVAIPSSVEGSNGEAKTTSASLKQTIAWSAVTSAEEGKKKRRSSHAVSSSYKTPPPPSQLSARSDSERSYSGTPADSQSSHTWSSIRGNSIPEGLNFSIKNTPYYLTPGTVAVRPYYTPLAQTLMPQRMGSAFDKDDNS